MEKIIEIEFENKWGKGVKYDNLPKYFEMCTLYTKDGRTLRGAYQPCGTFEYFEENDGLAGKSLFKSEVLGWEYEVKNEIEISEKALKDKCQYFNMKAICEKANVNYDTFRGWKNKGFGLSNDKVRRLLETMKKVAE